MEWIKIPTDNILYSEFTDSELVVLIKYQALYCQLESEPNSHQLKRILTPKQLKFIQNNTEIVQELCENQIKNVIKKRNRDKESYKKKQTLTKKSVNGKLSERKLISVTDKIREEKKYNISFEDWYNFYPLKKSKEPAKKSWYKLSNEEREKAFNVVKSDAFKEQMNKQNNERGDFRPHPSTWLNQKRWEDEISNKNTSNDTLDDINYELLAKLKGEK